MSSGTTRVAAAAESSAEVPPPRIKLPSCDAAATETEMATKDRTSFMVGVCPPFIMILSIYNEREIIGSLREVAPGGQLARQK
eukprot:scaffold1560_cov146-Skeletonema_dohrnii-CCMP3373.AAC.7